MLLGPSGKKKVARTHTHSRWFPREMTQDKCNKEKEGEEGKSPDLCSMGIDGKIEWNSTWRTRHSSLSSSRACLKRKIKKELLTRTIALHLSFVIIEQRRKEWIDVLFVFLRSRRGKERSPIRWWWSDHLFCSVVGKDGCYISTHRHASSTEENLLVLFSLDNPPRQIYIYIWIYIYFSCASPSSILISLFLRLLPERLFLARLFNNRVSFLWVVLCG